MKEGGKIVLVGSVGVCVPFAELFAHSIRDKGMDMVYVPKADLKETRKMKLIENIGYRVADEKGDTKSPDVIVILGDLAMPKYGCLPEDVIQMIKEILAEKEAKNEKLKIIEFCSMSVFEDEKEAVINQKAFYLGMTADGEEKATER